MKISVIVVTLNAGSELAATIDSIIAQDFTDIEIVVKDGGSTDGSVERLPKDSGIRVVVKPDKGIYDAMNQALNIATGDFCMFLNCGDYLYDRHALSDMAAHLGSGNMVVYGDIYDRISGARISSNPSIDEFALYRNVPCHQACIYDRKMLLAHPFEDKYIVRADYEQFLWCYYIARSTFVYVPRVVSSYQGGGFSETRENRRTSAREHKEITATYMSPKAIRKYRRRLMLTLAPLRTLIARTPVIGKFYNRIKTGIYDKRVKTDEET